MSMMTLLADHDIPYSPAIVNRLIRLERKKRSFVSSKSKLLIFRMMKRVIMRSSNKFFAILRSREQDAYYEMEDMIQELFMICSRCVDKYDPDAKDDFLRYFNSAVNRRISRIANYKRVTNPEVSFSRFNENYLPDEDFGIEDALAERKTGNDFNEKLFWEDIETMKLAPEQKRVLLALFKVDKRREQFKEAKMSRQEFYNHLEGLQKVVKQKYIR